MQNTDTFVKLDKDVCLQLGGVLDRKYSFWRKDRRFQVSAYADHEGTYAKVVLSDKKKSFYYPVEARIGHFDHEMSRKDAAFFLLDYIDCYFEEFFKEDENIFLKIDWATQEIEGLNFQIRGQVLNLYMEDLANRILSGESPQDVIGNDEKIVKLSLD